MRRVKSASGALVVVVLLLLLVTACGGGPHAARTTSSGAPLDNAALAAQVTEALGAKRPLVCTTKAGFLASVFNHRYNRICGVLRGQPAVYISLDTKHGTWCAVSPRFARACPR
jgi:hypothetical protein